MCLSGIHFFFAGYGSRGQTPVSNSGHAPQNNASNVGSNSVPTSELESRDATQLPSCEPRARSDHTAWEVIKAFSTWTAQNVMALVQTGRLRSTLIENFKNSLEQASSGPTTFNYGEIYKCRNRLLDIGCKPAIVMRQFESMLTENSYATLEENFDNFKKFLNEGGSVAKNDFGEYLLRNAFSSYSELSLKGEILSAHSILKGIEKLLNHMLDDGFDISKIRGGAWKDVSNNIKQIIYNAKGLKSAVLENRDLEEIKCVKNKLSTVVDKVQNQRGSKKKNKVCKKFNADKNSREVNKSVKKTEAIQSAETTKLQSQGQEPGIRGVEAVPPFSPTQAVKPHQCGLTHTSGPIKSKSPAKNGSTQQTEESKKILGQVKEVFLALSNLDFKSEEKSLARAAHSLIKLCAIVSQETPLEEIRKVLSREFARLDDFKKEKIVACGSLEEKYNMELTGRKIRSSIGMKINQDAIDLLNKHAGSSGRKHVLDDIQRNVDLVLDIIMTLS